jgi:luxR family two component transcriptional regulator
MSAALRVLVVDDQQLLRRGLIMLFGTVEGVDVVAQAAHGDEALAVLRAKRIDVVLADAKMPVMDGIELVRQCARSHPGIPVLVLTTFDEPDIVRGAIAAGAAGFLLKDTSVESLAEAVRAVADGGLVIDPRVARLAFTTSGSRTAGDESPVLAVLTPTERKVASLVAEGLTNQAIAARMVLAEGTVKNHVSTLLHKLQTPDRTALALTLYKAFQS